MYEDKSKLAKVEGWFVEKYTSSPIVQALAVFVAGAAGSAVGASPILAGLAGTSIVLIDAGFQEMRRKRQEILFDELAKGERFLSEELIGKEEFLQAFTLIYRAAIKSQQKEKIQRFARILLTGVQRNKLDSDDLEEFIGILEALSDRELKLLRLLKKWEDQFPLQINAENNEPQYQFQNYWDNFEIDVESQLDIKKTELPSMLGAITRTGLYTNMLGLLLGSKPGQGVLSPRFLEFIKWIENESLT
jgi:hypothetical protein